MGFEKTPVTPLVGMASFFSKASWSSPPESILQWATWSEANISSVAAYNLSELFWHTDISILKPSLYVPWPGLEMTDREKKNKKTKKQPSVEDEEAA